MNDIYNMRVLQVMEATLGGTRRYLEDVSEALGTGAGFGVAYSLRRADDAFMALIKKLGKAGWQLFEVDMGREIDPLGDFNSVRELRRVFASFKPDIVHAHSSKAGALARIATVGIASRPCVVYTPHSIASNVNWIYGMMEKVLAARADIICAVTESERNELLELNLLPPDQIHVVVPTVSSERFAPRDRSAARREVGLGAGPVVISSGRLTVQKDPLAFIDLVAALREHVPEISALWVGDGELRGAVEERIAAINLQHCVTITGWLQDVRPFIAAADVVISTSRYESFGYVTAEALSMARPVVASQINGTVDIVRRDTDDQLFRLDDLSGAVDRVIRLLASEEHATEIGRRGKEFVNEAFSLEQTRRGLNETYTAARLVHN